MQYKLKNLVNEIKKKGYIILPNLISKNKCEKFKKILNKNFDIYKDSYCVTNKDGLANKQDEKVVFNLHNKDLEFFELFQHKNVLDILDVLLLSNSKIELASIIEGLSPILTWDKIAIGKANNKSANTNMLFFVVNWFNILVI